MAAAPTVQQKPVKVPVVIQVDRSPRDLETYAECGDAVEWFPSADKHEEPHTAIVSKVGLGGVVVANVISPYWNDVLPKEPCYHVDDPKARMDANQDGGGWRHKRTTVATRKLLIGLAAMWWENGKLVEKPEVKMPEPKTPPPA